GIFLRTPMVAPEEQTAEVKEAAALLAANEVVELPAAAVGGLEEQGLSHAVAMASREVYPEANSIYVGNLEGEDDIWPEQIVEHFKDSGNVKRVIIKIDRGTGERLGYAYVDFDMEASAEVACSLDGSTFLGRQIK
ncbi:unnamed protein product, partial [Polarella glacialis]